MKKKSLIIDVPEPCHENWSIMTPVEQGRHCQVCQKNVVDFSRMSKAGIVQYLENNSASTCGRFTKDQLNVDLLPPRKNRIFSRYAALLIGLFPATIFAQQSPVKTEQHFIKGKRVMKNHNHTNDPIVVDGTLMDKQTGEPILFGTVALFDEKGVLVTGVETDLDGKFSIPIADQQSIEVSYIGYESVRYGYDEVKAMGDTYEFYIGSAVLGEPMVIGMFAPHPSQNSKDNMEVDMDTVTILGNRMSTTHIETMGIVSVVHHEKSPSWLSRVWKRFKNLVSQSYQAANAHLAAKESSFETIIHEPMVDKTRGIEVEAVVKLKLYPNPTSNYLNLDLGEYIEGDIRIQIVDEAHHLVVDHQNYVTGEALDVSHLHSGSYILSIVHGGQLITSQLFVKI